MSGDDSRPQTLSRLAGMNGGGGAGSVCGMTGLLWSFKKDGAGYTHWYTLKHAHTHTDTHTQGHTCLMYVRTQQACAPTLACVHTHTLAHAQAHTHTHTHTHICHTHTHTHTHKGLKTHSVLPIEFITNTLLRIKCAFISTSLKFSWKQSKEQHASSITR